MITTPRAGESVMLPELNEVATVVAFIAVIAVGTAALWVMPMGMTEETVLTMVLPSMTVFGVIMLIIGIAHGKYRARSAV